jgi:predicted RNA-binding protein with TRAM domain
MEIPDQLRCLFTAKLEEREGSFVIDVPEQELELGDIDERQTYRVAILPSTADDDQTTTERNERTAGAGAGAGGGQQPPVEEGEQRTVEIDDIGDKGDGITRVERGFVVIVPDTETGERVTVEITDVRETVAFAEVVERVSYYE